jgi:hypothetical protein
MQPYLGQQVVFSRSAHPQLPPVVLAPRKQPRHSTAAAAAAAKAATGSSVCLAALRSYHGYVRGAACQGVCIVAGQ